MVTLDASAKCQLPTVATASQVTIDISSLTPNPPSYISFLPWRAKQKYVLWIVIYRILIGINKCVLCERVLNLILAWCVLNCVFCAKSKGVNTVTEAVPVCPAVRYISDTGVPFRVYRYFIYLIYIYIYIYIYTHTKSLLTIKHYLKNLWLS